MGTFCHDIEHREISDEEGQKLASEWRIPFYECSSETGLNVDEMFMKAASLAFKYSRYDELKVTIDENNLEELKLLCTGKGFGLSHGSFNSCSEVFDDLF